MLKRLQQPPTSSPINPILQPRGTSVGRGGGVVQINALVPGCDQQARPRGRELQRGDGVSRGLGELDLS